MAKKKATKIISKKHLARQEREARQTRAIIWSAIGVIALIILGIAYGVLNNTLFLRWRPAVTVNGESLSLYEFQVRVRAYRQNMVNQYMYYTQLYSMFGMDPSQDTSLQNISSQLDQPSTIGGQVIDLMVNDLLIRQYAAKNGITVTQAEVQKAIEDAAGYFPNGTPTPTLTPTTVIEPTLNATQLAMITPTFTPTTTLTNTPLPTNTGVPGTAVPTSTNTPVPSLTPTATPYTAEGFQKTYQDYLKNYSVPGMNEEMFRRIYYEDNLYQTKVKDKLTANVPHTQDEVWARHILVANESLANAIYKQLTTGQGNFATLAAQYSTDTSNKDKGGDLGWFAKGKMVPEFENAIWDLPVGTLTKPVKTQFGYHIIEILGHDKNHQLTEAEYSDAVTTLWDKWLTDQRAGSKVVINNDYVNYIPTSPSIAEAQAHQLSTQTALAGTYFKGATQTAKVASPTPTPVAITPTK